jgi:peptidoglycan hydrolase-like protein with peptidoglycan-binding domain
MRNQSEGFTDTANFQNWDTLTVAYHPLTGIAVAFSHGGRNVLEMFKFKGGNIMGKKKSALTAAVIFGVGLAATPAFSQSAPGGKSVPPDLERTPTTPGREQQLPPSGREIPKGTEGMSASDIKQVQQALKAKGHDAGTSGVMDDKTREAIRAFQKAEGLTMTGTVDDKTAQALGVSGKSSSGSGASGSRGSSGAPGTSGSSGAAGSGATGKSSGSSGSTDKAPSR